MSPLPRRRKPEDVSSFCKSASLPATVGIWGWSWVLPSYSGSVPHLSQVIGALPWVVNSASVATPAPAQSLQVQAVTPQLLLNAQGQVIATLASSPLPQPVAVRKPNTPESPAKSEVPALRVWAGMGRRPCLSHCSLSKVRCVPRSPEEGFCGCTRALPRETAPFSAHHTPHTCARAHRGQRQ